jgi:hypothetical protein
MYDEAYKVYAGVINKIPEDNKMEVKTKSTGLLGRRIGSKPEKKESQPIDRVARYVASIRKDRREFIDG